MKKGKLGIENISGNGEGRLGKENMAGDRQGGIGNRDDGRERRSEKYLPWCSVGFLGGVLEPDTRKSPPQDLHHRTSNCL